MSSRAPEKGAEGKVGAWVARLSRCRRLAPQGPRGRPDRGRWTTGHGGSSKERPAPPRRRARGASGRAGSPRRRGPPSWAPRDVRRLFNRRRLRWRKGRKGRRPWDAGPRGGAGGSGVGRRAGWRRGGSQTRVGGRRVVSSHVGAGVQDAVPSEGESLGLPGPWAAPLRGLWVPLAHSGSRERFPAETPKRTVGPYLARPRAGSFRPFHPKGDRRRPVLASRRPVLSNRSSRGPRRPTLAGRSWGGAGLAQARTGTRTGSCAT